MCFVLVALGVRDDLPLVIAANRDEYLARPAASARWWADPPMIAGRDEQAGGAWFGLGENGRFAVVTNRRVAGGGDGQRSRGELVPRVLGHRGPLATIGERIATPGAGYRPFNLLYGDAGALFAYDNAHHRATPLAAGIHALSNAFVNTPWPKVEVGKRRFAALLAAPRLDTEALFALLADPRVFEDDLPDTGLSPRRERALSAIFIDDGDYGTRCSTVCTLAADGEARFLERSHAGQRSGPREVDLRFRTHAAQAGAGGAT